MKTKEIMGIQLERYRVPAVREFLHSIDEAAEACLTVKEKMSPVYQQWKAAYNRMVEVYEISLKSEDSEIIRVLDERRDNMSTAIRAAANSFRKAQDDETRRRGTAVWDALNSFRVMIDAQYNIQTAQIDSLLGVLLGEQLKPSVEALGMLQLVTELKTLNDRLHELVGIRDLENIGKPEGQRQESVAAAIAAYRNLVRFVNAYYIINVMDAGVEDPALDLFIDLVNSIILRYRRNFMMGSSSGSGSSNGSETEGEGGSEGGSGSEDGGAGGSGTEDSEGGDNTVGGPAIGEPTTPGPGGDDPDLRVSVVAEANG